MQAFKGLIILTILLTPHYCLGVLSITGNHTFTDSELPYFHFDVSMYSAVNRINLCLHTSKLNGYDYLHANIAAEGHIKRVSKITLQKPTRSIPGRHHISQPQYHGASGYLIQLSTGQYLFRFTISGNANYDYEGANYQYPYRFPAVLSASLGQHEGLSYIHIHNIGWAPYIEGYSSDEEVGACAISPEAFMVLD